MQGQTAAALHTVPSAFSPNPGFPSQASGWHTPSRGAQLWRGLSPAGRRWQLPAAAAAHVEAWDPDDYLCGEDDDDYFLYEGDRPLRYQATGGLSALSPEVRGFRA